MRLVVKRIQLLEKTVAQRLEAEAAAEKAIGDLTTRREARSCEAARPPPPGPSPSPTLTISRAHLHFPSCCPPVSLCGSKHSLDFSNSKAPKAANEMRARNRDVYP